MFHAERQTDEASSRFAKFCRRASKASDLKRHKHQFAVMDVPRNNLYTYFTLFKGKLRAGVAQYDCGVSVLFPTLS
jgi:hypothetical protein